LLYELRGNIRHNPYKPKKRELTADPRR